MQKLANIGGAIMLVVLLVLAYDAAKDGFQKTLGPFDDVKVKYKWMDHKTGDLKCVAKAPGEKVEPCDRKNKEELSSYKLLWEIPEHALATAAYARKE